MWRFWILFLLIVCGVFFILREGILQKREEHKPTENLQKEQEEKQEHLLQQQAREEARRREQERLRELQELRQWQRLPKIILDPGHGGTDPGTTVAARYEKELTLDVALRVARYLYQQEIPVEFTRREDSSLSLQDRVDVTQSHAEALFVSIHMNSFDVEAFQAEDEERTEQEIAQRKKILEQIYGIETYWCSGQNAQNENVNLVELSQRSKRLAELVHAGMLTHVEGVKDREVRDRSYKVIREPQIPAILVECGFLSHPEEREKLLSVDYREELAYGIASGLALAWEEQLMLVKEEGEENQQETLQEQETSE